MIDNIYIANFRRIREADIEFRDGITCLTGLNGSGKSTVIEAIEFCLYGRTRPNTTKDTVRRHGAEDSEQTFISIDFSIGSLHYRCNKYLTPKLAPIASLRRYDDEEYARLREGDSGEPIRGRNPRQVVDKGLGNEVASGADGVKAAVTDLFGVDYDGFKASFVARQKELDSLGASLTPTDRKAFLIDLLGYSRIDAIRKSANDDKRSTEGAIAALERQMPSPTEIEKQIAERRKELDVLNARVAKGAEAVDNQDAKLADISERLRDVTARVAEARKASQQLDKDRRDLARHEKAVSQLEQAYEEGRAGSEGYDPQSSVGERLERLRKEQAAALTFADRQRQHNEMVAMADTNRARLAQDEEKAKGLAGRLEQKPDIAAARRRKEQAASRRSSLQSDLSHIQADGQRIKGLLADVDAGRTAACPTCGTDISSADGRRHLQDELAALRGRYRQVDEALRAADAEVEAAGENERQVDALIRTYNSDQTAYARLSTGIEMRRDEVRKADETMAANERWLSEHGQDERTGVQQFELSEQIEELNAQKGREDAMRAAFQRMRDAQQRLEPERQLVDELRGKVADGERLADGMAATIEEGEALRKEKDQADADLRRYRSTLEALRHDQGAHESTIRSLEESLKTARAQAESLRGLRSDLVAILGAKDVIDALRDTLPSKIAPTLSDRASALLDCATNGLYHMLTIDEDYSVSVYTDEAVQPISMMSGGEQDIISLCIRLAIAETILDAKALSQQTLFLDEIFGALDDERRASACEALRNLGEMLPRIVCITHIDEIKDLADHTYVVERMDDGTSRVREVTDEVANVMPHAQPGAAAGDVGGDGEAA